MYTDWLTTVKLPAVALTSVISPTKKSVTSSVKRTVKGIEAERVGLEKGVEIETAGGMASCWIERIVEAVFVLPAASLTTPSSM